MILRTILLVHRYLGVVVGLMMVLWCLSGFVMMYQGYPRLTDAERLRGLAPLQLQGPGPDWAEASGASLAASLPEETGLRGFSIEMLAQRPILRTVGPFGEKRVYELQSGRVVRAIDTVTAEAVAQTFTRGNGIGGRPHELGLIKDDQWTVQGAAQRGAVHHIRFDDPEGNEVYVAERTGEVVQATSRRVRFWSYLGAVPHWIYPVILRRNGPLWDQVVVWTSLCGVFLTVTGAYVGISRFRLNSRTRRWSPYRGWFYWHHILGLVFGVLTLTWVASGLFTMNPWGFLDTPVGFIERAQLAGPIVTADMTRFAAVAPSLPMRGIVQLEAAPLGGHLFVMALAADGTRTRLNDAGVAQPLAESEVRDALAKLGGPPLAALTRLDHEDAYYYSGYQHPVNFPVYRVQLANAMATTYYLDAVTGRLVDALDDTARESRWLRTGLHDIDFTQTLRQRPLWDIAVLVLLAGVTASCITGVWLAIRRVFKDLRRLALGLTRCSRE
jgi:uncharacterized iron-regulated membrane protein